MKCLIKNVEIKAIATCLPQNTFEMNSLKGKYEDKEIDNMMKTTGVVRVHVAEQRQTTSDLCFEAAELLLKSEDINKHYPFVALFILQPFVY